MPPATHQQYSGPSLDDSVLAHEYGYLDAKHGMGYEPRPSGCEKEYAAGYKTARQTPKPEAVPAGTYADKTNWGWY